MTTDAVSPDLPERVSKYSRKRLEHAVAEAAPLVSSVPLEDVRFTMSLDGELAARVERARKRSRQSRLAWIRQAIIRELDGSPER